MQAIAAENNLAETAFFCPRAHARVALVHADLEVDLCGHATLAAGHVVFRFIEPQRDSVSFRTMTAGTLVVSRRGDTLAMDFPARPAVPIGSPPTWSRRRRRAARGIAGPRSSRGLRQRRGGRGARSRPSGACECGLLGCNRDRSGRRRHRLRLALFRPAQGVPEDPVTGSSRCTLVPYWAGRLGKIKLEARQLSRRGRRALLRAATAIG